MIQNIIRISYLISTYSRSVVIKHVHVHVFFKATFVLLVMEVVIHLLLVIETSGDVLFYSPSADPNSSVIS